MKCFPFSKHITSHLNQKVLFCDLQQTADGNVLFGEQWLSLLCSCHNTLSQICCEDQTLISSCSLNKNFSYLSELALCCCSVEALIYFPNGLASPSVLSSEYFTFLYPAKQQACEFVLLECLSDFPSTYDVMFFVESATLTSSASHPQKTMAGMVEWLSLAIQGLVIITESAKLAAFTSPNV